MNLSIDSNWMGIDSIYYWVIGSSWISIFGIEMNYINYNDYIFTNICNIYHLFCLDNIHCNIAGIFTSCTPYNLDTDLSIVDTITCISNTGVNIPHNMMSCSESIQNIYPGSLYTYYLGYSIHSNITNIV